MIVVLMNYLFNLLRAKNSVSGMLLVCRLRKLTCICRRMFSALVWIIHFSLRRLSWLCLHYLFANLYR